MPTNGDRLNNEELDRDLVAIVGRTDTPAVAETLGYVLRELRGLNSEERARVLQALNEYFRQE